MLENGWFGVNVLLDLLEVLLVLLELLGYLWLLSFTGIQLCLLGTILPLHLLWVVLLEELLRVEDVRDVGNHADVLLQRGVDLARLYIAQHLSSHVVDIRDHHVEILFILILNEVVIRELMQELVGVLREHSLDLFVDDGLFLLRRRLLHFLLQHAAWFWLLLLVHNFRVFLQIDLDISFLDIVGQLLGFVHSDNLICVLSEDVSELLLVLILG